MRRFWGGVVYALSTLLALMALAYPFVERLSGDTASRAAPAQEAPLITAGLVCLSLLALLIETQGETLGAKMVAMLGVLVAITSALRFLETIIPLPGGFSPMFAPVILAGYVFGARFGFLLGVFALLVSALITGGVGPWLPYQMFTTGWVGMSAGGFGEVLRRGGHRGVGPTKWQILWLAVMGFAWGILYGVITNIYFWPYAIGPAEQTLSEGLSVGGALAHFVAFSVATSLAWDVVRGVGNATLILLLGGPVIQALGRFQRRFHFQVVPGD